MPGMAIALAVTGASFAAVCVWLAVRVVNRRERWAKWTLAGVVGLPVLYVASFGPACWIPASSLVAPQQHLGHSDPATTLAYVDPTQTETDKLKWFTDLRK